MASAGDFLSNVLLGGLSEVQQRRKQAREQQNKLAEIYATAKAKSMFPDPLSAILLQQMGGLSEVDRRSVLGLPKTPEELGKEKESEKVAELRADPGKAQREKIQSTAELIKGFKDVQSLGPQPSTFHRLFTGTPSAISPEVLQTLTQQLQQEAGGGSSPISSPLTSDDQFYRDLQKATQAVKQGAPVNAVKQRLLSRHRSKSQQIDAVFSGGL